LAFLKTTVGNTGSRLYVREIAGHRQVETHENKLEARAVAKTPRDAPCRCQSVSHGHSNLHRWV